MRAEKRMLRGWLAVAAGAMSGAVPLNAQQEEEVRWAVKVQGFVTLSSPALSPDGSTIYVGVVREGSGRVVALNSAGASTWLTPKLLAQPVDSSPAVGADGTIYIGCVDGRLYALNPADGATKWTVNTLGFITSSPAVGGTGSNETIYIGSSTGRLHAVTSGGTEKWAFPLDGKIGGIESSPAVAADGTIYFGSDDRFLYALTPGGSQKWRYPTGGSIFSSPAIGADGTIYVGSSDQKLYAVSPEGTLKWTYSANGDIQSSPVLGADGTVYFGADVHFYALNPNGPDETREKWKTAINTTLASSAAVRGDGVIIFGADDGKVRALNPDGKERWVFDTRTRVGDRVESSPVVAPDGSIYVGSEDGNLYRIRGNGSPLSAYSSWPAFRRDIRHTAQAVAARAGGQLVNISTRAQAGAGRPLIAGFVVQASTERAYLVRAVGPGLAARGVGSFLPDPVMDLFAGQVRVRTNDNWLPNDEVSGFSLRETASRVEAFALDTGSADAAILPALPPGAYTALVGSADGRPGVALVEVYDVPLAGDLTARLINLSTRGFVGTGENILIAGFVIGGTGPMRLLLRGIGPGLTQFGVPSVLAQPRITLFSGGSPIGSNTGWTTDGYKNDLVAAAAAVSAFPLVEGRADSAMLFDAKPGAYTIQISGVGGATGEALVEIYVLP